LVVDRTATRPRAAEAAAGAAAAAGAGPIAAAIRLGSPAAWYGTSLLVTGPDGGCGAADPLSGFFVRETRHLRTLRLELDGAPPWWCEWTQPSADRLSFVFVHPELARFGGGGSGVSGDELTTDEHGIPHRALDLRLDYALDVERLEARLRVRNGSRTPVATTIAFVFDADFADLLEAAEDRRQQTAPVTAVRVDGSLELRYGHPRLALATRLRGESEVPAATRLESDRWSARLRLEPGAESTCRFEVAALDAGHATDEAGRRARRRRSIGERARATRVVVPGNPLAQRILERAAADLASLPCLDGPSDEWLSPHAGVPLYPSTFGRDALTAGWQGAMLDRGAMLDAALTRLGRRQADRDDPWRDAEPGRLPLQVRDGPLARLDLNPFAAYYADFAGPLMFVVALGNLWAWTGERELVDRHWTVAGRVLAWAERSGDRDGDGYLEYRTRSPLGAKNQGWKDSGDAIVDERGRPVPAPIAACELQGYWYAALQTMAVLAWTRGERDRSRALWRTARALKRRFNVDFWDPEQRFYGLALDPDKRLVRTPTSNVGHCLACGILARDRLPAVVGRLLAPDLFSGWGVRTLSARHPAYSALGYHLGTVWPVENATICFGLRRLGFEAETLRLARSLFELAALYPFDRLPECVGGYARDEHPTPGAYPRANPVQAWNSSAPWLVLQSILGLAPLAAARTLLVDPVLPDWLPEVELHGLRVGATTATLRFWRDRSGRGRVRVLARDGPLRLLRQPPPEARVGASRRLRGLLRR
jgi:glycogen debranching enzyme